MISQQGKAGGCQRKPGRREIIGTDCPVLSCVEPPRNPSAAGVVEVSEKSCTTWPSSQLPSTCPYSDQALAPKCRHSSRVRCGPTPPNQFLSLVWKIPLAAAAAANGSV